MKRRVVITGLGPVTGLGTGADVNWQAILEGRSAIDRIDAFDPDGFDCRIAAQIRDFKTSAFVPKSYRKATKVMARDIALAVASADLAARDAGLATKGTINNPDQPLSYDPTRVGAHVGAGLIAVDLDELTEALVEAQGDDGHFDYHRWGSEGINHLTPLWLLKYLPNMLACHVTIIHDAQGPTNTITCAEASALLSIGESLRVIQRDAADLCFCGGAESKLNPMAFLRQSMTGRLNIGANHNPGGAVRPFSRSAAGGVVGEGAGIVTLEALDTYQQRLANDTPDHAEIYAEVVGFGASQTPMLTGTDLAPDPRFSALHLSIKAALREADLRPDDIDVIVPFGIGVSSWDKAEVAELHRIIGDRLSSIPLITNRPLMGNCGAGVGGLDLITAAKAVAEQTVPPRINCDDPIDRIAPGPVVPTDTDIRNALVCSMGFGGQNAAMVLRRFED